MAGLWRGALPVLLASTSRTRLSLLEAAGLPVETEASGVNERDLQASLGRATPAMVASRLAEAKALSVSRARPHRIVIGADQVLDLDGEALGKPGDPEASARQLARLSGRTHGLMSAVAFACEGRIEASFVERAELTMRALSRDEIGRYLAHAGEAAIRSAGGYEIEGLGIHLFDRIDGEHSTILGLPLVPTLAVLRRMGLVAL